MSNASLDKKKTSKTTLIGATAVVAFLILLLLYLKPVFFGLLFAVLFLPIQQWLYHKFLNLKWVDKFRYFFTKMTVFSKKSSKNQNQNNQRIKESCTLTVILLIVFLLLGSFVIISFLSPYLELAHGKITEGLRVNQQKDFVQHIANYLKDKSYYETIEKYVSDFYFYLKNNAPLWGKNIFITSVGGTLNLIFQIFLTFFFFIFFLQKVAFFHKEDSSNNTLGNYIVDSFFKSSWTPMANSDIQQNIKEIINTIITKLKTWFRGYTKIIAVETIYYFVCFMIIGVPYALLLSIIAGSTILLPFLGPVLSILMTLGVYFAVNGVMPWGLLILILLIYAVMNLIIEQFVLYPNFVGEALGLTTLETIVVVLLGGLIGNIPGAILAVPIASILKYIVPKIYQLGNN